MRPKNAVRSWAVGAERRPTMPKSNIEVTFQQLKKPAKQPLSKASPPTKNPRASPSAGRAPKRGATPARRKSAAAGGEGKADDRRAANAAIDVASLVLAAGSPSEGAAAYTRVLPEIKAVPRQQVRRLSVYVPNASVLVLGAVPKMLALREAMSKTFVNPPFARLDKLRDYALAAAYAHARVLPHDGGQTRVQTLLSEATPLRERMLSSAGTLVTFGLLDARKVAAVRRGTGNVDTAQDVLALSVLFREAGPEIIAKTPLTLADVERAGELGGLLLEALGFRQSGADGSGDPDEAEELLGQAYELMASSYEECRQVVLFLRWREGDADSIAPPLGHSRRRARRPQADEPDEACKKLGPHVR
jgi:hypothetical protein